MLDQLPVDLFRTIVQDYLEHLLEDLLSLAVAFCNHARRVDWLSLCSRSCAISLAAAGWYSVGLGLQFIALVIVQGGAFVQP